MKTSLYRVNERTGFVPPLSLTYSAPHNGGYPSTKWRIDWWTLDDFYIGMVRIFTISFSIKSFAIILSWSIARNDIYCLSPLSHIKKIKLLFLYMFRWKLYQCFTIYLKRSKKSLLAKFIFLSFRKIWHISKIKYFLR